MVIYIVIYTNPDCDENRYASTNLDDCLSWCKERNIVPYRQSERKKLYDLPEYEKFYWWIQEIDSKPHNPA